MAIYCTLCPDGIQVQCTALKGRDKYMCTGLGAPRLGSKGEEYRELYSGLSPLQTCTLANWGTVESVLNNN